jgi:putative addiction module component (TIGR02574 family)
LQAGVRSIDSEMFMAQTSQMTPQVSGLLEKALALSTQERGLLIDLLVETLDNEPAEGGVDAAWDKEIKRRVDDIRSGRVTTIPGDRLLERLKARQRDARQ